MRSIFLFIVLLISTEIAFGQQRYVFYLHGAIIESEGPNAVSSEYGPYQYFDILRTFRSENFTVLSENRKPNTDVVEYAHHIVDQINGYIKTGIEPGNITVVGASKGGLIAMFVSSFLKNPKVNFVLLACCNDNNLEQYKELNLCGNILSIYEKSDAIGHSCEKFIKRSNQSVPHYKEIVLNTGLKHGFLYRPLPEWVKPTVKWANRNYN